MPTNSALYLYSGVLRQVDCLGPSNVMRTSGSLDSELQREDQVMSDQQTPNRTYSLMYKKPKKCKYCEFASASKVSTCWLVISEPCEYRAKRFRLGRTNYVVVLTSRCAVCTRALKKKNSVAFEFHICMNSRLIFGRSDGELILSYPCLNLDESRDLVSNRILSNSWIIDLLPFARANR
jgi:hypothetical protein